MRYALLALGSLTPLLSRIIANDRPCRFCAIAVTLATHTCIWLRAQFGGRTFLSSIKPPSAALSLSYYYGVSALFTLNGCAHR